MADEPAQIPGATHIATWFERHLAPDLAALRRDAAEALGAATAGVEKTAALAALLPKVLTVLQAVDPAAAAELGPLVTEAETIAAAAAWIAAELAARAPART